MAYKFLSDEDLEVLKSLDSERVSRIVIGAKFEYQAKKLVLICGDFYKLEVPFDFFTDTEGKYHPDVKAAPDSNPDFTRLQITDGGLTITLGNFVAAVDAILLAFRGLEPIQ